MSTSRPPDCGTASSGVAAVTCLGNTGSPIDPDGLIGGVLIDSWTEAIPGSEVTTGVGIHFDAPSSRAPQAVLLATTPPGQTWDRELLRDTLKQTLEVTQQRSVGPETLRWHGQFLPALFLPDTVKIATEPRVPADDGSGS